MTKLNATPPKCNHPLKKYFLATSQDTIGYTVISGRWALCW